MNCYKDGRLRRLLLYTRLHHDAGKHRAPSNGRAVPGATRTSDRRPGLTVPRRPPAVPEHPCPFLSDARGRWGRGRPRATLPSIGRRLPRGRPGRPHSGHGNGPHSSYVMSEGALAGSGARGAPVLAVGLPPRLSLGFDRVPIVDPPSLPTLDHPSHPSHHPARFRGPPLAQHCPGTSTSPLCSVGAAGAATARCQQWVLGAPVRSWEGLRSILTMSAVRGRHG